MISYEIISSSVFLSVFTIINSPNYEIFNDIQEYQSIILFIPSCVIILYVGTLMETNRPPFDLSEAESDVVSGYTVEYAGILFGLFYLGEYVNLFTTSLILSLSFFGA
jgi:NADH:ubiquinone oxidoreductase subunit H